MTESATARTTPVETELGPETLLWQIAGDRRVFFVTPAAGILQNMLPGVSKALETQSVFFDEPIDRTVRSVAMVVETIYDQEIAIKVRDYHRNIKGVDDHGQRYHAMSPELYFAAHAVFVYIFLTLAEVFIRPLSEPEKEQLYGEFQIWFRRYGVSDRHMPATWPEFQVYWDTLCRDVMENTPVTQRILDDVYENLENYPPKNVSPLVWRMITPLTRDQAKLLTTALIPPICRAKLGLSYSRVDRLRFAAQVRLLKLAWAAMPASRHDLPRIRQSKARALRLSHPIPAARN